MFFERGEKGMDKRSGSHHALPLGLRNLDNALLTWIFFLHCAKSEWLP
jgi:hypothetical protein